MHPWKGAMSDTPDPSSSAAQSALPAEDPLTQKPGFFGRLFGVVPVTNPDDETSPGQSGSNGASKNGAFNWVGMSNLRSLRVDDVLIPRAEIVSVPCDISLRKLVAVFRKTGMTRLPVYDGTPDTPIGLIHLKDLALRYGFEANRENFDLREMLRPLLYAPPSMPIGVLLQKMQTERRHMALVIDEYGGVDGLVTIEDLIEQVIGEIEDEHDIEGDQPWTQESSNTWLAMARAPLEEFEAEIGVKLVDDDEVEEIDTLGGLVFLLTGRVPARGEVIPHPTGPEFEIIDADPRRIKRIRVRLPEGLAK
jgi:magnesium and cobalt transporter